ncbi:MAG: DNA polymerase III subunit delta', partial [Desulfobacterales bacterium]|nr:DNA polymerase III subunit delta' [Desulfobacterales bacterium]
MSGFELLINQERPIKIITALLKNRTLPHALLFTGTAGVGKQAVALALAMACNCRHRTSGFNADDGSGQDPENPSIQTCGACKSCRKIKAGNHPDIIQIQPSGPFIKIEQIRALLQTLSLKPYEAKTRMVIISEAHCMNAAAGNALLKILEEPPDRTMLVLVAPRKSDLLPTIASRCQLVKFNRISNEFIASWLQKEHGLKAPAAKMLSEIANGSLGRAQKMIDANWLSHRKWMLAEVQSLSLRNIARVLALAEKLALEKEVLNERLEMINVWFRDLVINRYDSQRLINRDMADQINTVS